MFRTIFCIPRTGGYDRKQQNSAAPCSEIEDLDVNLAKDLLIFITEE